MDLQVPLAVGRQASNVEGLKAAHHRLGVQKALGLGFAFGRLSV